MSTYASLLDGHGWTQVDRRSRPSALSGTAPVLGGEAVESGTGRMASALIEYQPRAWQRESEAITEPDRPDVSAWRATATVSSQRLRGSARAGVHPDGCMVETYDQMARHCRVRFVTAGGLRHGGQTEGLPG